MNHVFQQIDSNFGTAVLVVATLFLSLGCSADTATPNATNLAPDTGTDTDVGVDIRYDPPAPPEPRDPADLPGADTAPGENPCGDNANCRWNAHGVGTDHPFDDEDLGDALLDEDGAITLDDSSEAEYFAWIPNTAEGTISRIDTEKRIEVARYRTGPAHQELRPSRTTVASDGSVYVANAHHQSVTKIALAPNCISVGGAPEPSTSTGPDDLLDWGDDDCVEWHEEFSGFGVVDAVAIQETGDDAFLWVGAEDHSIWKVDAETGQTLFRTESPVSPNGFALDSSGGLWISTYFQTKLGLLDTEKCLDHGSCEAAICQDSIVDCVKSRFETPANAHGIAIDGAGRIWLGGDLMRFDPGAPQNSRWAHTDVDFTVFGVASDGDQWIYAGADSDGLYRIDSNDPGRYEPVAGTAGRSVRAIDIDHRNFAWSINRDHNDIFVVDPGPGIFDGSIDDQIAGFEEPDAYSDMIGSILRFDAEQRGVLRLAFEECAPDDHYHTEWQTLRFDAEAEGGSLLRWRVRAANTEQQLANAPWIDIGSTPPTTSPVDLRAVLGEEGLQRAGFIEIEAYLVPHRQGDQFYVPRLATVDVIADCPKIIL